MILVRMNWSTPGFNSATGSNDVPLPDLNYEVLDQGGNATRSQVDPSNPTYQKAQKTIQQIMRQWPEASFCSCWQCGAKR